MRYGWVMVALVMGAGAAGAEPLPGKEAKALLFAPAKAEAEIRDAGGLSEDDKAALKAVAEGQAYYGAIAVSPDEGMMSEATVAAVNYHDTAAAEAAALADCNARKTGQVACVVVALIRPKGWTDRGFGLSSDATLAFKGYDNETGALAISAATGAFGLAAGEGAEDKALAACQAMNEQAKDCVVAIAK